MKYLIVVLFALIGCSSQSSTTAPATTVATEDPAHMMLPLVIEQPDYLASRCPHDMIEVVGNYCPRVEQRCLHWLDISDKEMRAGKEGTRCAEFAPSRCLSDKRVHKEFCIDKYEWPGVEGQIPQTMLSYNDMERNCKNINKRMCGDSEWTFACEGEDMLSYPYGNKRDSTACNIDNSVPGGKGPDLMLFLTGKKSQIDAEVARLNLMVPSGSMPGCKSPFGVMDLTGNIDETVKNESGHPYVSGSKGGHWFKGARNRCRPMTIAHNPTFSFYEYGGRCCKSI